MSRFSILAKQNLVADLEALDRTWNPPPDPYLFDPVGWMRDVAEEETWSAQREIMESVAHNRYTAVKSCHGPGKSFTASRLVAWWTATKPDPFVVTSAPTSHQVRSVLWREVRKIQKKLKMPGHISQGQVPEWKIGDELVAFGRKPADYLDPNEAAAAFQGIHAQHVLVVLDEGSGIPEWLANACETLITNENSRLLIIGNPDNPISWFAKCFRPGSGFNQISIPFSKTPAATGEKISPHLREVLVSKLWAEERKRRWGENSPLYISKVLAEFPEVADDVIFSPSIIAIGVAADRSGYAVTTKGRAGMDIARLGPDETVVYHNRGGYVRLIEKWAKLDTMETVGRFRRIWKDDPDLAPTTTIDVVGIGSGPYDRLRELGYPVVPFNGGEKAFNPERYKNRRSEAYWEAKEMMSDGVIDLEELDEDLQAELMEHHYKHTSTGQIQIEPKEDIAQRLGRSPDRADAFVMSLQKQADLKKLMPRLKSTHGRAEPDAMDLTRDIMDVPL